MDPLMIPKSCVLQGEKITIRYRGDIQIENDLVPLSVKSEEGGIRFIPEGRSVSCSHLSAENGILEVEAERVEADTLHAMTAILRINDLEIHQVIQASQEMLIESEKLKAQELRASELELTAAESLDVQSIVVEGQVVITFDHGKVHEIRGRHVTVKGGASFECERIVATEEVVFTSGKIAVKFIDAPKITADPSVTGIVILTQADDVRAEGVRGFIRPNEFRMLTEQGPLLSLTDGSSTPETTPTSQSFDWAQGPQEEPAGVEQPETEEEVSSLDLDFDELSDSGMDDEAVPEEVVEDEGGDIPELLVEDDGIVAELVADEEPLVEVEPDLESELVDAASDESDQDDDEESQGEREAEVSIDDIKTASMEDEGDRSEVDEFMTREIRDFDPSAAYAEQPPPVPKIDEVLETADDDQVDADMNILDDDEDVLDEVSEDDDAILDVMIPSEEIEHLPEITDFEDLPEMEDGVDVSLNEDANSGPVESVPTVAPIPTDDEEEEAQDDILAEEQPPDLPPPINQDVDQSMHLDESMTYTPEEFSAPEFTLDNDDGENELAERLNGVLGQIKDCFPDDNYPKFINQIQTYLDERRFGILRKQRNREAVLSSFDRLSHDRISELARAFYAELVDYFGDEL